MRSSLRAARLAALLAGVVAALSCHSPTGPQFADIHGAWEEVTETNCNGARRSFVVVAQTGAQFTAVDGSLQADLSGHISGNTATLHVRWMDCGGSAEGALTIQHDNVTGSFSGTATGDGPGCCGTVNGTLTWGR